MHDVVGPLRAVFPVAVGCVRVCQCMRPGTGASERILAHEVAKLYAFEKHAVHRTCNRTACQLCICIRALRQCPV